MRGEDLAVRPVRRQAVEHNLECIEIGKALGSKAHTVWIGDGGNYPGQMHFRRALDRYPRFRERCFTDAERAYCDSRPNPAQSYAGRFAGKEAVGKALGFGVARAFAWRDIEIAGRPKPSVRLSGRVAGWAERVGAGAIDLSMTHSRELANAVAVVDEER